MLIPTAVKRLAALTPLYQFVVSDDGPHTRPYRVQQPDGNWWTEGLLKGTAIPLSSIEEALALNRRDFALYVEYRRGMSTGRGRAVKPTHTWVGFVCDIEESIVAARQSQPQANLAEEN